VNGVGSSVAGSGNNLTVNAALTFQSAFGGAKNVYLYAVDNAELSSNWQQRGTWMVPGVANQPPMTVSVTPSSGSGSSRTFSFVFSPNGFAGSRRLRWVQPDLALLGVLLQPLRPE
jgi:hypothetical protein